MPDNKVVDSNGAGATRKECLMIEKGEVFILTSGMYADYDVLAVCRAEQNLDCKCLWYEYVHDRRKDDSPVYSDKGEFLPWLIQRGLVKSIDYTEWDLY